MQLDLDTNSYGLEPGSPVRLGEWPTSWRQLPELSKLHRSQLKKLARQAVSRYRSELADLQERLWAGNRNAVLLVLQGMDACGKDSTIKHVTRGMNPSGLHVSSFKEPTEDERNHHFLWRYSRALPQRGDIAIFNRSYYEDVMAARVHPEAAGLENGSTDASGDDFWRGRCQDISNFEHHLTREGILVIKCFLHVSREAQRRRLLKRLRKPEKHWKFSSRDLQERLYWDAHVDAMEHALSATSTRWAPWHIVPADHKWLMRALVARMLVRHLEALDPAFPEPDPAKREAMDRALKALTGKA